MILDACNCGSKFEVEGSKVIDNKNGKNHFRACLV